MKQILYIKAFLLFSCFINAQEFPLTKNGKFNIKKFKSLKEKDTPDYSVITPNERPECKKVIIKKDHSSFYYCGPSDMRSYSNDTTYTESREYSEYIDGFRCIINEYSSYDSAGRIIEYNKYLSKIPDLTNLYIEMFPLEEKRYENGKLVSSNKTTFNQKLHNIMIVAISVYGRDKLGMQGHDGVGMTNYDNYKVTFKNNTVQTENKKPGDPEISRSEIIKAFTSLKSGFSIYRTSYRNADEQDEWVITFNKDGKEYAASINDKTGNGTVSRNDPKDISEVI